MLQLSHVSNLMMNHLLWSGASGLSSHGEMREALGAVYFSLFAVVVSLRAVYLK